MKNPRGTLVSLSAIAEYAVAVSILIPNSHTARHCRSSKIRGMASFRDRIQPAAPNPAEIPGRRWIYVPYDRLTDRTGPLTEQPASATGVLLIESRAKGNRRAYHKKKLVLLLANMRHFALEQANRGCKVIYHLTDHTYGEALLHLQRKHNLPEIVVPEPAERELRLDLAFAQEQGLRLRLVLDTTWLSTAEDFAQVFGPYRVGRSYVMDRFYRSMRQQTKILMEGSRPHGGKFSFDSENRKPFRDELPVPIPPEFLPDELTLEVISLVEEHYPNHFGSSDNFCLPVTQQQADQQWQFAVQHLLPHFGPFEDAMRDDHLQLFHSRTSPLINLSRLLPADLIRDVEQAAGSGAIPLASAEGFIRQLLGWREFMRHLHRETDGYRLVSVLQENATQGTGAPNLSSSDIGATPSALSAELPLPAVYWGAKSGLHCIDTVVAQVIEEGWSHHITRLMVLSNLATLCGFSPRQLTDWFWIAYIDAYDWVVETNVLGMATYADGGLTATKPYVSGAAYIHRMSNYCGHCQFDPKRSTGPDSCPFTALYWTFLERNQPVLASNFRLQMPYASLNKKPAAELVQLRARAAEAIHQLQSLPYPKL